MDIGHKLVLVTKDGAEALREADSFISPCISYNRELNVYVVAEGALLVKGGEDSLTFSV